jgi:hypothetical protein
LSVGDADLARLTSIARLRTEPASRVERARILLGHREERWFFAVGQALGGIIRPCSTALTEPWPIVDRGVRRSPALEPTITKTTILDLPRFVGEVRGWDQGIWFDSILSSCFTQFFCWAPGGSHSSVPARTMGAVVARSGASRTTLVAAQRACP